MPSAGMAAPLCNRAHSNVPCGAQRARFAGRVSRRTAPETRICARHAQNHEDLQIGRRALGAAVVGVALQAGAPGTASAVQLYDDTEDGFSVYVPDGWKFAVPTQPYDRFRAGVSTTRTLVWYPPEGTEVNVTIVINTPAADYTSLRSFGSAQDFGTNLVSSMDRSFMIGKDKRADEVQVCKLVAASTDGVAYGVEYTIKKGLQEQKHLYSRVIMGDNGRFRRLYTVTATCPESKVADIGSVLKAAVGSLTVQNTA